MRSFCSLVLFLSALTFGATVAHARGGVLLAADDPKQISEVDLAQVMAPDSTHWLSVRLKGRARLALISTAPIEEAATGDAWLRALDRATRERISTPPGPLAGCPDRATFPLVDSGYPDPQSVAADPAVSASSDVELQRNLSNAGIAVDSSDIATFTAGNPGPYQLNWFETPFAGGASAALRWVEHSATNQLPAIRVAGAASVPVTLIALASDAVLPAPQDRADPSEFAVRYFAIDASSDYLTARASWLRSNTDRWLVEAANTSALFDLTVLPEGGQVPSAVTSYFSAIPSAVADHCETKARAAHGQASRSADDFLCRGADDLLQTLSELDFGAVRLTRLFGSSQAPGAFTITPAAAQNPSLIATDFSNQGCSPESAAGQGGSVTPGYGMGTGTGTGTGQSSGSYTSGSESRTEVTTVDPTYVAPDSGGCGVSIFSSSDDSCSGDSSSSSSASSSNDSCSGDPSSSDSSSSDSCSGDSSSSDSSSSDSCSGDSDSSSNDSSGCGSNDKSGYNGDTCSGNSATSTSQSLTSPKPARPRPVRLSLLTLFVAALSLPLRRRLK